MATNYSPSLIVKVPSSSASSAVTDQNTGEDLLEISSLPYEDLRWEKTSSYNYGVDMGLFDNKIRVGFEYYVKKGKDMITSLLVPREYGIENMPVNGGSMNNSGWELSVSFTPVRTKNFTWDMVRADYSITIYMDGGHIKLSNQNNEQLVLEDEHLGNIIYTSKE